MVFSECVAINALFYNVFTIYYTVANLLIIRNSSIVYKAQLFILLLCFL